MTEAHAHKGHAFSRYNASHVLSVFYEAYQLNALHHQPALMDFLQCLQIIGRCKV